MRTFCITIPTNTARLELTQRRLQAQGVEAELFYGMDAKITGLDTKHPYEVDNPGSGYLMGPKVTGIFLSHYLLWKVLSYLPESGPFMVLEDDVDFRPDWKPMFEQAMTEVPADADLLYAGSCNAENKPKRKLGQYVYAVQWPQCTHAYVVWKKALPILLDKLQKVWAPIDLAMVFDALPHLRGVYTVLPRLASQMDTSIAP